MSHFYEYKVVNFTNENLPRIINTWGDHFHLGPTTQFFVITHRPMDTQINLLIFCIQFYIIESNIRVHYAMHSRTRNPASHWYLQINFVPIVLFRHHKKTIINFNIMMNDMRR